MKGGIECVKNLRNINVCTICQKLEQVFDDAQKNESVIVKFFDDNNNWLYHFSMRHLKKNQECHKAINEMNEVLEFNWGHHMRT